MALTFEFIQPGEFDDPYYDCKYGFMEYKGKWIFSSCYEMDSDVLDQISAKLKQLNGAR